LTEGQEQNETGTAAEASPTAAKTESRRREISTVANHTGSGVKTLVQNLGRKQRLGAARKIKTDQI
jgi:hypothetical protein